MRKTVLKVALVQIGPVRGDVEGNLERVRQSLAEARRMGCEVALLPEVWSTGFYPGLSARLACRLGEGHFAAASRLSREHGLYLAGSLFERSAGEDGSGDYIYNTAHLYGPAGSLLAAYRKIHVFRHAGEDRYIRSGDRPVLAELPTGTAGLAVCYDLRFPELFRGYAAAGASVILLPAAWPAERSSHWRLLLQARAVENQCYMAGVNCVDAASGTGQSGESFPDRSGGAGGSGTGHNRGEMGEAISREKGGDRRIYGGGSMLVDPWGRVLVELGDGEEVGCGEIDLDHLEEIRRAFPVLGDRRLP
ncbi:MAG: carbon-nitrogen family hydrolase [Firmicutes bacterium]|nr:carbon-nitrogen family hydrolase [Bacillota bacterium]